MGLLLKSRFCECHVAIKQKSLFKKFRFRTFTKAATQQKRGFQMASKQISQISPGASQ
jgi:hypothetical protein